MGSKQSKIEDTFLPDTPMMNRDAIHPISVCTEFETNQLPNDSDPRSPNSCRTPINFYTQNQISTEQPTGPNFTDKPLMALRKRFLKGFTYNLNDPRSPTAAHNRTPLVFDELGDKALNLDDTFSDLFVESRTAPPEPSQNPSYENETQKEHLELQECSSTSSVNELILKETLSKVTILNFSSLIEDETMQCTADLKQTPKVQFSQSIQQELDPRSPTVGLDRTPIIFNDDDDVNSDAVLENVLATLSLDISNVSSIGSLDSPKGTSGRHYNKNENMPTNKHLERVRIAGFKRGLPQIKASRYEGQRQRFNLNDENGTLMHTPKSKFKIDLGAKRTPLSCVKNRNVNRSRSVELSAKPLKPRMSLASYDDTFNPLLSGKINIL